MNVGEQIRMIAKQKGINHSWISDKINMNQKTFSGNLKRDSFTAKELLQIAIVLNLDLNEMKNKLDEEEQNNMEQILKMIQNNHQYIVTKNFLDGDFNAINSSNLGILILDVWNAVSKNKEHSYMINNFDIVKSHLDKTINFIVDKRPDLIKEINDKLQDCYLKFLLFKDIEHMKSSFVYSLGNSYLTYEDNLDNSDFIYSLNYVKNMIKECNKQIK